MASNDRLSIEYEAEMRDIQEKEKALAAQKKAYEQKIVDHIHLCMAQVLKYKDSPYDYLMKREMENYYKAMNTDNKPKSPAKDRYCIKCMQKVYEREKHVCYLPWEAKPKQNDVVMY